MRCLMFLIAGRADCARWLYEIMAFSFLLSPLLPQAHAQPPAGEMAASSREWEKILPVAQNLKSDGEAAATASKPILLFFNLAGCHYCRGALREVIVPMFRNAGWRAALEFRQINVDDGKSLIDFDGKTIENRAFANKRKGAFTPTVMIVDGSGQLLGEPIIGIANFDFYGAYVDSLANKAIAEMKARK
jgi:thioredoxin-related protein